MRDLRYIPRFDEILQSVFHISVSSSSGTCFVCRLTDDKIIVITCKHMFPNSDSDDTVNFSFMHYDGTTDDFSGTLLYSDTCQGDICAIIVNDSRFSCAISFNSFEIPGRVFIGDEIFVLGFPFIMTNKTLRPEPIFIGDTFYPQAILRHGYVASSLVSDKDSKRILLDLHNNPGFSGSPIIKKGRISGTMDFGYIPIGVISGYYYDKINDEIKTDTNSGISYGCPFDIIWRQIMEYKYKNEENKSCK